MINCFKPQVWINYRIHLALVSEGYKVSQINLKFFIITSQERCGVWCFFFFFFVPCFSTKSGQHNVTLHFFVLPLGSLASIFIGLFSCLKGLCNYINVNEKKYLGDSYMCNGREEKKKTNVTDLSVP